MGNGPERDRAAIAAGMERHAAPGYCLDGVDWPRAERELDLQGWTVLPRLLGSEQCDAVAGWYDQQGLFRSRILMSRHGFGRGEYQYFRYPLPAPIEALRTGIYPRLVPLANRWNDRMRLEARFPPDHAAFLRRCHRDGQAKPTPLLLSYAAGDYNCLHQDLYGDNVFPLQLAVLLSAPGEDFGGGEFLIAEQRPRMQSRASVVPLAKGDAVIFAVSLRPVAGSRGDYRATIRHGVSPVRSGRRRTLGIIFHDSA